MVDIGGTNDLVNVNFNTDKTTVSCEFINQASGSDNLGCLIGITYGANCEEQLAVYNSDPDSEPGQLSTQKLDLVDGVSEYCFVASATFGENGIIIEGTFNILEVNNPGKVYERHALNLVKSINFYSYRCNRRRCYCSSDYYRHNHCVNNRFFYFSSLEIMQVHSCNNTFFKH